MDILHSFFPCPSFIPLGFTSKVFNEAVTISLYDHPRESVIKQENLQHCGNLWMIIYNDVYFFVTPYKMEGPLIKINSIYFCAFYSLFLLSLCFSTILILFLFYFFFHSHSYHYLKLKWNQIIISTLYFQVHPNIRIEIIKFIHIEGEIRMKTNYSFPCTKHNIKS